MTTQEEAFTAYYKAMTDAELLRTAANKTSFVDVAQRLLTEELTRRHLELKPATEEVVEEKHAHKGTLAKVMHKLHHLPFG